MLHHNLEFLHQLYSTATNNLNILYVYFDSVLEDRKLMAIMARNDHGSFTKLCTISINQVGSVYDLRQDIATALRGPVLNGQGFVLMDESLVDIPGPQEKKLVVSEVFGSESVFIRWLPQSGKE